MKLFIWVFILSIFAFGVVMMRIEINRSGRAIGKLNNEVEIKQARNQYLELECARLSGPEEVFTAAGVPAEWVAPVQKAGFLTVEALHGATAGKLHQELCGINKKYKLGLKNPTIDEVTAWIEG